MFILITLFFLIVIVYILFINSLKFKASKLIVYKNHWSYFKWKPMKRKIYLDYMKENINNLLIYNSSNLIWDESSGTNDNSILIAHDSKELQKELELVYNYINTDIPAKSIYLVCSPHAIIRHSRLPFIDINQHPQIILEKIKLAKAIIIYPHFFIYLCAYTNIKFTNIIKIWFISEVVEPKLINNWIKKNFPNAKWQETYGATECIPMGFSCKENWLLSLLK